MTTNRRKSSQFGHSSATRGGQGSRAAQQSDHHGHQANLRPLTEAEKLHIQESYAKASFAEKTFFRYVFSLIAVDNFEQVIHLFNGAYILIQDGGIRYDEWANMEGSRSHDSNLHSFDKQFAFQGNLVKECVFGTRAFDSQKATWLQLKNPSSHTRKLLAHFSEFILSKLTDKNIDSIMNVNYTESRPLLVKVPAYRTERIANAKLLENMVFGQHHDIPELRDVISAEQHSDNSEHQGYVPKSPRYK